ncbi:MAG: MarR family winged helix-turn-helix transcriptional regulator [Candidatus Pararuminococcus gallinarum]|jgi:DNA-binding MarR family transcriptional regulator|uniref:MarR family winged helix-turn-helix transcriptional regulator n=1 Tax=Zongyangia sp. HA2173 TaxID=3133035 RepID=UPI001CD33FBC
MEAQSIGSMIKILSETIGQKVNKNCKEFNLTMQQMKILHFLRMREGEKEASQKEIQNFMRISHPTVVNILRLMKEKGFIETSTSHEDKRMKIVRLTGKEDKFVKDVISEREEMEKQLVKGLTQKDQENLRWYLKKMYENLTEAS